MGAQRVKPASGQLRLRQHSCAVASCGARRDAAVWCASRCMQILCDEVTYAPAKYKAAFEELAPLPVKGKAAPVQVYK